MLVKLTSFAIQLDLFIHKCGTNFVFITLDDEQNSNVSQSILILTIWKENRQPGLLSFQFVTTWKNFSRPQFIYSEKATKFRKISRFDWHYIGQIYGGDFAKFLHWRLMQSKEHYDSMIFEFKNWWHHGSCFYWFSQVFVKEYLLAYLLIKLMFFAN